MPTITNLLKKAVDKIRDALYLLAQGYDVKANIDTSYTVPVTDVKDEIFETFTDFQACVIAKFPDALEKGEFIDASKAFPEEDPKRCVYYWGGFPQYGTNYAEYDTGTVKNFRWTICQGNRKAFGPTLREAIDYLYTCPMLNHKKDCS